MRMAEKAGQKRLSLLFTGGSGTGKTAFAHYLAGKLGRRIIVATPSQILQKWWGNTERNIRHLFKAGEQLAGRLAVQHNLWFYNNLMTQIRNALDEGRFAEFRAAHSADLGRLRVE